MAEDRVDRRLAAILAADIVARHLGVHYVLEGSVRTSGDRVRISAQLIEGQTGNHVWAEKYDRKHPALGYDAILDIGRMNDGVQQEA
jgi:TolB-like protein